MTATKPKSTLQRCSSPPNDSLKRASNGGVAKRTRGPINKRACQRCRQGKIKCDGDAEMGKPCSNCDPQNCIYDNSPRKNKQVEQLRQRMGTLEDQLVTIVKEVDAQLSMKDLEKEVLCQLCESKELFNGSEVLQGLLDAVKQSKLSRQMLIFTRELLQRMSGNQERIPDIIQSLQKCIEFNSDLTVLSSMTMDQYRQINNGEYELVPPPYNSSILLGNPSITVTDDSSYDATATCLDDHSQSENGSETLSGEYGSGSPPTSCGRRPSFDDDSESYSNSSRNPSQVPAEYYYPGTYYASDYIEYNPYFYSETTSTTSSTNNFIL